MPWSEVTIMSQRLEFVILASQPDVNLRALCRRFGISPTTGYTWLARYHANGTDGLYDQSRRPHSSPTRTSDDLEAQVVALRKEHPAWGGRTLAARLDAKGVTMLPAPSTITGILRRNNLLDPAESPRHTAYQRFEHPTPNALWQMDFKGHFAIATGRCHPLTVLDDHSRFSIVLKACANEQTATVQEALITAFSRYGLPAAILSDNGSPWGDGPGSPYTRLGAWLIRLGIRITHSRPYHPQTQGKEERFHRTLKAEVLRYQQFDDLTTCQQAFDNWRDIYNLERPHQALAYQTPSARYQVSSRPYPEILPSIEYSPNDEVRKVQQGGDLHFRGRCFHVSQAFTGYPVAIRPLEIDGRHGVYFCHQQIAILDLTSTLKEK
jgi:transposase InsO family protein